MALDSLTEPGNERGTVLEVLDGQPDHRHPAALPLQVPVAVVRVTALAAVMGPVDLQDQDTAPAHDQDVRASHMDRTQADTRKRRDRDGVLLRETSCRLLSAR